VLVALQEYERQRVREEVHGDAAQGHRGRVLHQGVERSSITSLFTSNVRYNEVVEDGFRGGNIVAADFAGTPEQLARCARTC
jgi:hypothetical protein